MSEAVPEWEEVRAASAVRRAYLDDVFFQIQWAVSQLPTKMQDIDIAEVNERVTELAKYLSREKDDEEETWLSFFLVAVLIGGAAVAAPLVVEFIAAGSIFARAAAASTSTGVRLARPTSFKDARGAVQAWTKRFPDSVAVAKGGAAQATKSTLQRLLSEPRPTISETEATSPIPTTSITHIAGRIATEFDAEKRLLDATTDHMKELEADATHREELWSLIRSCDTWIKQFAEQMEPTSAAVSGFRSLGATELAKALQAANNRTKPHRSMPTDVSLAAPLLAKYTKGTASPAVMSGLGEQLLRGLTFALTALSTNPTELIDRTPDFYDRYQRHYHLMYSQYGRTEVHFGLKEPSRYLGLVSAPYDARKYGFGYRLDGRQVNDRAESSVSRARVLAGLTPRAVLWAPPDFTRTFFEAVSAQRIKLEHAASAYFFGSLPGEGRKIQRSFGDEDHERWIRRYREETALTELAQALLRYRYQTYAPDLLERIDKAVRRLSRGQ